MASAISGVIERESVVGSLSRTNAPTLIITGEQDMPRPTEWADEMDEHLPHSELWRLPRVVPAR